MTQELPSISSHESSAEQNETGSVRKEEQRVVAQCRQAADVTGPASRISPVFIKAEDEIREVQAECVFRVCVCVLYVCRRVRRYLAVWLY